MLDRTIVLGGSITVVTKAQVAENLCFGTALRLSIINFISFFFFFLCVSSANAKFEIPEPLMTY